MSKAGRSIKDMIQKSRTTGTGTSLSNIGDNADVKFPKIKNQKAEAFLITEQPENYNFTKTKKETQSIISKELMEGLDDSERMLLDELVAKIEEQRLDIEKRNQNLYAIQRNFESLSVLCKNEKAQNIENVKIINQLKEENNDLTTKHRQAQLRVNDLLERIKVLERDSDKFKDAEKKTAKLKEEVQGLKDRIRELEKILEKKRLENAEQEARIKELLSKAEQFKMSQNSQGNELKILEEEINKLKIQCEGLEQQNQLCELRIVEDTQIKADYEHKIKELTAKMGKMQSQFTDTNKNCKVHMEVLETLKRENAELKEKLDRYGTSQDVNILQMKIYEQKLEQLESEKRDLNSQLTSKNGLIEKYVRDIDELKDQLQLEINKYAKYRDIIMMYEDFKSKNQGDLVLMTQQIAQKYEQELADLREELSQKKKKIHELIDEKAAIEVERQQLQTDLSQAKKEISEACEKKESLQREVDTLNKDLQDKIKKMNKAQRDFADEAIKSKELSDANDALKRELEDKRIHILSLETKLSNRSASERNSMLNVDKLNEEIRILKSQIEDQLGSMSRLDDKSKKFATEKDALIKENLSLKDEILRLKKDGSDLESVIDNLRADLNASAKALEDYKLAAEKDRKQLEAQIANLKEEMASGGDMLIEELGLKKKEIQRLSDENENLRRDLTHKEREYDKLYLHSKATLEEKKEVESRVDHLKGLCTKYTEEIDSKTKLLEKNFQEILTLKSKMNSLLEELKRFDGIDVNQVKARIKQLETREATLYNAIIKIEHAEDSLVASLSCCHCMELLKDSITCVPCGHSYCSKCKEGYEVYCKECQDSKNQISNEFFKNKLLDAIAAKISYNRLTFEAVKEKPSSKSVL